VTAGTVNQRDRIFHSSLFNTVHFISLSIYLSLFVCFLLCLSFLSFFFPLSLPSLLPSLIINIPPPLSPLRLQSNREKERREAAEREAEELNIQHQLLSTAIGEKEAKVRELGYEVELQTDRNIRIQDELDALLQTTFREKSFLTHRTADLTDCVSQMRMGIVEAQGDLATQTMVNGGTALRATRESERIAERLDALVEEYELLWTHSQQQVRDGLCTMIHYLSPPLFIPPLAPFSFQSPSSPSAHFLTPTPLPPSIHLPASPLPSPLLPFHFFPFLSLTPCLSLLSPSSSSPRPLHSLYQDTYLRSSGNMISTLTKKMAEEICPPSPSKRQQKKLDNEEAIRQAERDKREAEYERKIEEIRKECRESLAVKEGEIAVLMQDLAGKERCTVDLTAGIAEKENDIADIR
jgi:hypothetical protein